RYVVLDIPSTCWLHTPSLHDALPIFGGGVTVEAHVDRGVLDDAVGLGCHHEEVVVEADVERLPAAPEREQQAVWGRRGAGGDGQDRKSTRLNSSHVKISYAVFCLKKK